MINISALLSVYHQTTPEELASCLMSIKNQSVQPAETIVVLDGPVNSGIHRKIDDFEKDYWERKSREIEIDILKLKILLCHQQYDADGFFFEMVWD